MTEAFTAYIKTITALTLFSALAGLLMPEGKFRKYLEMVLGILVLSAVVQPLLRLGTSEPMEIQTKAFSVSALPKRDYAKMQEKWVHRAYTEKMEEGILSDLQSKYSTVKWVRVKWEEDTEKDTYGSPTALTIGGNGVTEEIRTYGAERYRLPLSNVQIVTKDGE